MTKYSDRVWVFDDAINLAYQHKIKECLLGPDFSWFVKEGVSHHKDYDAPWPKPVYKEPVYAFSHLFIAYSNGESSVNSGFSKDLEPLVSASCKKIDFQPERILMGRSFLQLPLRLKHDELETPHVDSTDKHNLVVLYYVMDSDGDTVIYENKWNGEKIESFDNLVEKTRVSPKQGRVVMFDGFYFHTVVRPKNSIRCVINFNVI